MIFHRADSGRPGSRGSLSELTSRGNDEPEDKQWQLKALGMASIHDYEEQDILDDMELDLVLRVFGLYIKESEDPRFNTKYFTPAEHSNYTAE